jgi:hypothetical protein
VGERCGTLLERRVPHLPRTFKTYFKIFPKFLRILKELFSKRFSVGFGSKPQARTPTSLQELSKHISKSFQSFGGFLRNFFQKVP